MKRILLATVAFSLLATPMAFAQQPMPYKQQHQVHKQQQVHKPMAPAYRKAERHHWSKGRPLPAQYRRHVVNDYRHYHLRKPPRGYHWVQVDNEFLLIGITSGIISSIIAAH